MYRYSQRLSWQLPPNSLATLLAQKRLANSPLIDLTISNPTEAFDNYPHGLIRNAFTEIEDFSYRPEPLGDPAARRAIAAWYAQRGVDVSPERIVLTASSSEAYALLFKLFCDPGDQVLAPAPSYPLFESLSTLESVSIVPYRLLYDGAWFLDFASLHERLTSHTRAVVLVNPNNPTGSFLKRHEQQELFAFAHQHNLPVISDEVFSDYSWNDTLGRVPTLISCDSVLSFSLGGLSKSAGMPQMKLSWIVVNGPQSQQEEALRRLELLLDTYLSVNTPVQRALPKLLSIGTEIQAQIIARVQENGAFLDNLLARTPIHRLYTEGGWSAILQLPKMIEESALALRLLDDHNVVVQPGYFFDMPSEPHFVVSLITPPSVFQEGVHRIQATANS